MSHREGGGVGRRKIKKGKWVDLHLIGIFMGSVLEMEKLKDYLKLTFLKN